MGIFIDPSELPEGGTGFCQLLYLAFTYGYVLFKSASLIGDGSELLLLVPTLSNIVGSVVLPILGALPDGALILFSGLGTNAQEQLSVGVGALAGSTIMLLTLPWFLSIMAGRVHVNESGHCVYKHPRSRGLRHTWPKPNLSHSFSVIRTGVSGSSQLKSGGMFMLVTAISYVIIQGPAFAFSKSSERVAASGEHLFALVGLVSCLFFFCAYLTYQWYITLHDHGGLLEETIEEVLRTRIMRGEVSLLGCCMNKDLVSSQINVANDYATFEEKLLDPNVTKRLSHVLKPFFDKYDQDRNSAIDQYELANLFRDLGEHISQKEVAESFNQMDTNYDNKIDFQEFVKGVARIGLEREKLYHRQQSRDPLEIEGHSDDGDEEMTSDDEEEQMPSDLKDLPPLEQQIVIKTRALLMMSLGTILCLSFSDPMVNIFSELGTRTGIPSFYVSFVLAPLASNSSELVTSYKYALKKTTKTIKISLTTLQGASIMNNTFCLGIFMGLIYFKNLAWEYSGD